MVARLDRMQSNPEVIQLAATIGREFSYELFAAASELPDSEVDVELQKLVDGEVLFKKGEDAEAQFIFKHALIQDSAYNSLLRNKKQEFHKGIAEALEEKFGEIAATQPALLAHHFTETAIADKAIQYWQTAGQGSQARHANEEAISSYRQGLEVIGTLPEAPERDGMELGFQVPLATAILAARGYANPEAGPILDRARELGERVADAPTQFYILWGMWAWRLVRADLNICRELSDAIFNLAEQLEDSSFTCEAHFVPTVVNFYSADFEDSCKHAAQAIPLFDPEKCVQHIQGTGQDVRCGVLSFNGMSLWPLGLVDQAIARARESIELFKQDGGHPMSLAFAYHHGVWTLLYARQWEEANALAKEAEQQATDQGFALWLSSSRAHRGLCEMNLGNLESGLELLEEGYEAFLAPGGMCTIPQYMTDIAAGHLRAGNLEQAQAFVDMAFGCAAENDNLNHCLAETHRIQGEVFRSSKPEAPEAAEEQFLKAIEVAQSQKARSWELRATMSLAKHWQSGGNVEQAKTRLQAIYDWFHEGLHTPDLVDARELLGKLD